jgi:hypothetical protein
MRMLIDAIRCCGKFTLFVAGLYGLLGVLFLIGSLYMDRTMAAVGTILLVAGGASLLLFLLLAVVGYRSGSLPPPYRRGMPPAVPPQGRHGDGA